MGQLCHKKKTVSPPLAVFSHLDSSFDFNKSVTSLEDIRTIYRFSNRLLGNGNFGSVRLATLIKNPDFRFAVKTIQK